MRAFSLAELVLAVATLAVALLLVVALGLSISGRTTRALDAPLGTIAAENILNQLIYNVNSDTAANRAAWFAQPTTPSWKAGSYLLNQIDFTYTVDFEALPVGSASGLTNNHLIKLWVRVVWKKGSGPNGGQHQAELVRLVHEEG